MTLWDLARAHCALWPGVEVRTSRFAGARGLWVHGREFAHEHSESELDLRLPKASRVLYADLCPAENPKKRAAWMEVTALRGADTARVLEALRLAYDAERERS